MAVAIGSIIVSDDESGGGGFRGRGGWSIIGDERARPHEAVILPTEPVDLNGRLVMVVDDDPDVRKVGASFLRRLGCNVLTAGDGFEELAA